MSHTENVTPNPFTDLLGLKVVQCDCNETVVELELRPDLLNALGIGHGGVTMTMLDVAMGRGARMADPQVKKGEKGRVAVTAKMNVEFLRPATGRMLKGYAQVVQADDSQVEMKSWVLNERGKRVAQATGVFKYLKESRGF
ncbi:MAG: PaaI family thioesterase [Saezia sp.]